jgi:cleavage and polyadenylation specificity factor subunit 2
MKRRAEKQLLNEELQRAKKRGFIEEDEEDEEGTEGIEISGMTELSQHKHDIMSREQNKGQGFFKQTRTYPMFPFLEKKMRFDDYGEMVRPEDFAIAEMMEEEARREESRKVCEGYDKSYSTLTY